MSFVFGANSASTGYNLTRSLRTRSSATPWLNRTFGSGGNQKTWTLSTWVKRGTLGSAQVLLSTGVLNTSDSTFANFGFNASDQLTFTAYSVAWRTTSQVFRDPSAWYHIVLAFDTTQATAANRVKLYVNGLQVTAFASSTDPTLNTDYAFNQAAAHYLGYPAYSFSYFDGYKAETYFINGQQLTPTSFGSTNSLTGVWQPAAYTSTYGTNGFYLNFTDNSALTTSSNVGLGKDFSGNGNYWTTNNISITAGVTYDSMTDVPTLTSATAANFAVANPVDQYLCSITQGNLSVATNNGGYGGGVRSTIAVSSGKWYWESVITVLGGTAGQAPVVGIIPPTTPINAISSNTRYAYYGANGNKLSSAGSVAYGAAFSTGDVIGHALDLDAGTLTFYKNNTSQGTAFTGLSGSFCAAVYDPSTGGTTAVNFGQRPFSYTPPTGFVALNTYNLPTSTIVKGNTVMDATLYTGTGASLSVTNTASFKPDLVWVKTRSAAVNHKLTDSVRGATLRLISNTTDAEATDSTGLTSFNSNGFTVGSDTSYNNSGSTFVGWQWQAGQGTTSSNTNGSITSTVSVNASAGFSVVTYTGTNTATNTVGHGLGVTPAVWLIKNRTTAGGNWVYNFIFNGAVSYAFLNSTAAGAAQGSPWSTLPTSSVITLGGSDTNTCAAANNYVMYAWTPIAGYSAFGSYTGVSSTDGPFIYLGFRPRWIMIKRTNSTGDWTIWDTAMNTYNVVGTGLYADLSSAESSGNDAFDYLSNGFKVRNTFANINVSGSTYIYMAFAENSFKNSLAR